MGLKKIFTRLNLTSDNGLCILKDGLWEGKLPRRTELLIRDKLKPEAFFCFDRKPIILFYDSPKNKKELFKDIWNFNESPIVIINEPDAIEIYNGFSYLKDELMLEKLESEKKLDNFSYFELVSGKILNQYMSKLKQQNRVDFFLLENIREARNILINDNNIEGSLANALIGKCIFVRYLIDRNVKFNFEDQHKYWSNDDFCELLDDSLRVIRFFEYLKKQFNGEAFLLNDYNLKEINPSVFSVLGELFKGTTLTTGQQSLFDIYDFSIIPVEFISFVYEHFIGKKNQAKIGAYYTPKFLVDYILTETVDKYFQKNLDIYNCKVLDPACGSGIFLVETLRRIVERYIVLHKNILKRTLKELAENNIFGIDRDGNAVNVAIFSIYLVLLDYLNPKDIESFTFPNLIEKGNFHIDDFFDKSANFNSKISNIDFNYIIGNPPWKGGASNDDLFVQYIISRKVKESIYKDKKTNPNCVIGNKEIAQAFLLRTSDFSGDTTKCAIIVTSKTLYNLNAKNFREYFLHNYLIDKVFEFAPVRREIFNKSNDPSIAPAAILFFRYSHGKNTDLNEIIHFCLKPNSLFSLLKIFVLQRTDIKRVVQEKLKENDWLWKVLVYGTYLDFNFIRNLADGYLTIKELIDKKEYLCGQGLQYGEDKNGTDEIFGLPFITPTLVNPFYINLSEVKPFTKKTVHRIRDVSLYNENKLLIKKAPDKKFNIISAISYGKGVFKDTFTAIKISQENDLNNLRILNGLFSSKMFSYFILHRGSSIGNEREQIHKEKYSFPYIDNKEISKLVEHLESITNSIYKEREKILNPQIDRLKIEKEKLIDKLNNEIFDSFDLNDQERSLIDYANDITIPLIKKHKGYKYVFTSIPYRDKVLEDYLKIFLFRFENTFKEKHLKVDVWFSNSVLGVFFRVVPNSSANEQIIEWFEKSNEKLLEKVVSLGFEEITEKLFIQKDIRGFEEDEFYIIKPNEKKLWHKAIAYLDVNEFMNAILIAGKEMYHE